MPGLESGECIALNIHITALNIRTCRSTRVTPAAARSACPVAAAVAAAGCRAHTLGETLSRYTAWVAAASSAAGTCSPGGKRYTARVAAARSAAGTCSPWEQGIIRKISKENGRHLVARRWATRGVDGDHSETFQQLRPKPPPLILIYI
eukprot:1182946-Prorocentrum_minimum.AAC.1